MTWSHFNVVFFKHDCDAFVSQLQLQCCRTPSLLSFCRYLGSFKTAEEAAKAFQAYQVAYEVLRQAEERREWKG